MSGPHTTALPEHRMPFSGKQALLWASLVFILNFLLKLWHISSQGIALDEPFTIFWAQQPLSNIWGLAAHENNPPLHFIIQHFSLEWLAWSPLAIRFSSLIFSSIAGTLIFWAGNRHFGRLAGILAAAVFLLSNEHIYHAHEARTYALLCLLTLLALHLFLKLAEQPTAWKIYFGLAILNALLMYTHFLGFWVLLAQCLGLFLFLNWKKVIWRLALSMIFMLLLYLPNLLAMLARLQSVATVGTWVPKPEWRQLYGHINIYFNGPWGSMAWILAICILLFVAIRFGGFGKMAKQELRSNRKLWILAFFFLCMYGGIYLQSLFFNPAFIPRYLLFCSIPLILALSASISALGKGRLAWLAIPIVSLGMLVRFNPDPSNDRDILALVNYVAEMKSEGCSIVIAPDYFDKTYAFHAEPEIFRDYEHFRQKLNEKAIFPASSAAKLPDQALENRTKLILIDADLDATLPGNGLKDKISNKMQLKSHQKFKSYMEVWVYEL